LFGVLAQLAILILFEPPRGGDHFACSEDRRHGGKHRVAILAAFALLNAQEPRVGTVSLSSSAPMARNFPLPSMKIFGHSLHPAHWT
jgi:hypothetical protein